MKLKTFLFSSLKSNAEAQQPRHREDVLLFYSVARTPDSCSSSSDLQGTHEQNKFKPYAIVWNSVYANLILSLARTSCCSARW